MYCPYLKKYYYNNISKFLKKKFNYNNVMLLPKIIKVVLNMSIGSKSINKNYLNDSYKELYIISGQKPFFIKTKKSISNFYIRKNLIVSLKVTLRDKNMYEFIYKLINISLPRLKDFKGFSKNSFDYFGNFNFGINDHNIFPELFLSKKIYSQKGFNVSIKIKNNSIIESYYLLKKMNFPFV
ncbi:50S ribosomal protein L5 [Candidatus Vidania fulgoroideorum]